MSSDSDNEAGDNRNNDEDSPGNADDDINKDEDKAKEASDSEASPSNGTETDKSKMADGSDKKEAENDLNTKDGCHSNNDDKSKDDDDDQRNEALVEYVKKKVLKNKLGGSLMGLSSAFNHVDRDFTKQLNLEEFREGMQLFGIDLGLSDTARLFRYFDKNNSKTVDFNEFLSVLKPPMKECRKKVVLYVFEQLDKDGDEVLTTKDIAANKFFQELAKRHEKYKSGHWSLDDVYSNFINTFDDKRYPNGEVTKEEFLEYYSSVSCCVDRDDAFDLMMCNAFNMDRNKVKKQVDQFADTKCTDSANKSK